MAWLILDAHEVDLDEVDAFCSAHAAGVALMAEYVQHMRFNGHLRDFLLCVVDPETLRIAGLCWIGGNIVPVQVPADAMAPLVREIRRRGRRYSSIVGPKAQVEELWRIAGGVFGAPREIREDQPHLEINARPNIEPDPEVHPTAGSDFEILFSAAVAMFTEEVGYSPLVAGGGYERRVRSLVMDGRSLSRVAPCANGREVVFKADLGTIGFGVTQVQGVWVNPKYRGRGIAAPAMAAVVNYAHQHFAPTVSLYVNAFNEAALATYARVGFVRTDTFTTILF